MYGPPLFCALALWSAQAQANISFTIAPEHCSNADGSVNATVTGGVPPYSYSWSSGPTSEDIHGLPAGSYTLTVTDFLGAVQQNTAVVPNLPGWEWDPGQGLAQAIPSCNGDPGGLILFGGDIPSYPLGPGPHQNDAGCVMQVQLQDLPADVQLFGISTMCYWGAPGQIYAVNYTDVNGCPGYMEAIVPQPPQFYPVSILDIEGSCSGGANGHVAFSIPPEADFIYGLHPRLLDDQWAPVAAFANLATNWTVGWTYDVPDLAPGTYAIVRRLLHDTDFDFAFGGCGDTTYFTIPDLGPTCGNVSGTVVIDADEDCVLDFTDAAIPQMILEFMPGPYYATTNAYGEYSINLPLGNYTVEQQTALVDEHCVGNPGPLSVAGNMTFNLLDTATQALDIQLSLASGPARPGFELHYAIDLDNLTSATSNSNMVVMTFDPAVSYIGATPTPSNVSGNTITWNNAGALYYFQHRDISVRFQVPPDVGLIGTDLQATATVTPNAADVNAANNSATVITTVTGSYDPNDKTATTSSAWSRDLYYIDVDQWIDYTIRFQNTGTDTAFTVVITDTLPNTLDAGSLTIGAGSHPFTWELQDSGTLKFYFVNILLPDSNVNEPASHGSVSFRVRPTLPLLPGTVIENTANIYFDFNPPVITEPSVLTAEFSTDVSEAAPNGIRLSPNPASEVLMVHLPDGASSTFALLTIDGRQLQVPATRRSDGFQLEVRSLAPGAYLLRTEEGMAWFIKQ
ncbi:MAG: DUF11 domain-containing protein [Flavobacteriales bacterium]|nr:DUF11 domain-containing protein [Flavobacteriales bacterium]